MIVDNKGKTIAWEEEPSPYNSSTIDNNSAFTQSQGRDAIQPIQKDSQNNLGISENDDDVCCIRGQELQEALLKVMMTEAEHLSGAEIKFSIPKERYEEVKTAICNGSNCCYLIFDRNNGSFLRYESSEIGN
jgi:hypothetical protein